MDKPNRWRWAPYLAAFAVVACTYVWTITSNNQDLRMGGGQKDYYSLLVHGFLKGQLSLDAPVPPELLQCADPYDPAQRPAGAALHDASLYHGRYYIYYGVVPAALVLLPFRVVTGHDLPVAYAALGFAIGALFIATLLAADLQRRYFPRCGAVSAFLLLTGWGFACCAPLLLRRSAMYELPILSGAFFLLAALGCLYVLLSRPGGRMGWVAAAGLASGLAIGCRPTYIVVVAPLFFALPFLLPEAGENTSRIKRLLRVWSAAGIPLAIMGVLLAAYNVARFGRVSEFGLSYILSGVYESKIEHFRFRYVLWNAYAYLIAPGSWGRYFPFFHVQPIMIARPAQHFGIDYPFGVLLNVPFVWLAGFAFARWRAPTADATRARVFAWMTLGTALAMGGLLLCFYAAMARYLGDFAPALALVAVVGGMVVADRAAGSCRRWKRAACPIALAGLVGLSVLAVFAVSVTIYGNVRALNPRTYARLERVANAPVHLIEALVPRADGPLELRVRFPTPLPAGKREELLRTGWGDETDRVWVAYIDATTIALEYEHAGGGGARSEPQHVDVASEHAIGIAMGSLFPPESWPGYRGWTAGQVSRVLRRLTVTLDGVPVLNRYQRFHDGGVASTIVGGSRGADRFSGRLVAWSRGSIQPLTVGAPGAPDVQSVRTEPDAAGVWRLRVRFPGVLPRGREPLIVSGESGRGDFLGIEYLEGNKLRLTLDHWGKRTLFSEPIEFNRSHEYLFEISHANYAGTMTDAPTAPSDLVVRMDGHPVWRVPVVLYPATREDMFVGVNPIGGSSCGERFTGAISPAVVTAGR